MVVFAFLSFLRFGLWAFPFPQGLLALIFGVDVAAPLVLRYGAPGLANLLYPEQFWFRVCGSGFCKFSGRCRLLGVPV